LQIKIFEEATLMGKGDQRSRRGKIHRGTFGRRRPKKSKRVTNPVVAPEATEKKTSKKETETSE